MKKYLAIVILFVFPYVWAQDGMRKELKGKITSDVSHLEEIYIINRNTEKATETHKGGYFTVMAAVGDTLMFTSTRFKARQIKVNKENFEDLLLVALESMIQLDEVVIQKYDHINAVDLGIVPAGQASYTQAERKLKAGSGADNRYGLNTAISAEGIINGLTGKTAELRKNIEIEKKETLLKRIEDLFEERYFTQYLKIPEIYIKGFQYFIVENNRFTAALNADNKTMASFIMAELAEKYKDTICE
jgi:hypothetical protein